MRIMIPKNLEISGISSTLIVNSKERQFQAINQAFSARNANTKGSPPTPGELPFGYLFRAIRQLTDKFSIRQRPGGFAHSPACRRHPPWWTVTHVPKASDCWRTVPSAQRGLIRRGGFAMGRGLFNEKGAVLLPAPKLIPGDDLLSHAVTHAVPSAQRGLTALFGMGRGIAPSL